LKVLFLFLPKETIGIFMASFFSVTPGIALDICYKLFKNHVKKVL
jgi:hypothetical protein